MQHEHQQQPSNSSWLIPVRQRESPRPYKRKKIRGSIQPRSLSNSHGINVDSNKEVVPVQSSYDFHQYAALELPNKASFYLPFLPGTPSGRSEKVSPRSFSFKRRRQPENPSSSFSYTSKRHHPLDESSPQHEHHLSQQPLLLLPSISNPFSTPTQRGEESDASLLLLQLLPENFPLVKPSCSSELKKQLLKEVLAKQKKSDYLMRKKPDDYYQHYCTSRRNLSNRSDNFYKHIETDNLIVNASHSEERCLKGGVYIERSNLLGDSQQNQQVHITQIIREQQQRRRQQLAINENEEGKVAPTRESLDQSSTQLVSQQNAGQFKYLHRPSRIQEQQKNLPSDSFISCSPVMKIYGSDASVNDKKKPQHHSSKAVRVEAVVAVAARATAATTTTTSPLSNFEVAKPNVTFRTFKPWQDQLEEEVSSSCSSSLLYSRWLSKQKHSQQQPSQGSADILASLQPSPPSPQPPPASNHIGSTPAERSPREKSRKRGKQQQLLVGGPQHFEQFGIEDYFDLRGMSKR